MDYFVIKDPDEPNLLPGRCPGSGRGWDVHEDEVREHVDRPYYNTPSPHELRSGIGRTVDRYVSVHPF